MALAVSEANVDQGDKRRRWLPRLSRTIGESTTRQDDDDFVAVDRVARERREVTKAIVGSERSTADVQAFETDTYKEQTRKALVAARSIAQRRSWPDAMALAAVDGADGVGAKITVGQMLGQESGEFREWDDQLSPRWRSTAYLRATQTLLDDARRAACVGRARPTTAGHETHRAFR